MLVERKASDLKVIKSYTVLFLTCFIVCAPIVIETSSVFLPTDKVKLI